MYQKGGLLSGLTIEFGIGWTQIQLPEETGYFMIAYRLMHAGEREK
jgi:hypothetical protein